MTDKDKPLLERKLRPAALAHLTAVQQQLHKLGEDIEDTYQFALSVDPVEYSKTGGPYFDALSIQFRRAFHLLVNSFFNSIQRLEQGGTATIIDVLNFAEKLGLIESALDFREMKLRFEEEREEIDLALDSELLDFLLAATPLLLNALRQAEAYPLR